MEGFTMTSTEERIYQRLRNTWNEPANRALSLARDRARAEQLGLVFDWRPEDENPRDVYGAPSYYKCESCRAIFYTKGDCPKCNRPRVVFHDTGVYFDPELEHYVCTVRTNERPRYNSHGELTAAVLASLGMIDGAFNETGNRNYAFYVECELSGEALAELDALIASPDFERDAETLG
jgi:hypothetical protein